MGEESRGPVHVEPTLRVPRAAPPGPAWRGSLASGSVPHLRASPLSMMRVGMGPSPPGPALLGPWAATAQSRVRGSGSVLTVGRLESRISLWGGQLPPRPQPRMEAAPASFYLCVCLVLLFLRLHPGLGPTEQLHFNITTRLPLPPHGLPLPLVLH